MRLAKTETEYLTRFSSLWLQWQMSLSVTSESAMNPMAFVTWLLGKFANLRARSRRVYRSSVLFGMELRAAERGADIRWIEAISHLRDAYVPQAAGLPPATSAGKCKLIFAEDLDQLVASLEASRSHVASCAAAYLRAGLVSGLRPIEWAHVRLVQRDGAVVLIVRCAKWRAGVRGHRQFRRLIWPLAAAEEIASLAAYVSVIRKHLAPVQMAARRDALVIFNDSLRHKLKAQCHTLWPDRARVFSPYVTRHTAAARWKLDMTAVQIAALMGHLNDLTSFSEYAQPPKSGGLKGFRAPIPHPRDVAAVQIHEEAWREIVGNYGRGHGFR